jgi:hypothetical protein
MLMRVPRERASSFYQQRAWCEHPHTERLLAWPSLCCLIWQVDRVERMWGWLRRKEKHRRRKKYKPIHRQVMVIGNSITRLEARAPCPGGRLSRTPWPEPVGGPPAITHYVHTPADHPSSWTAQSRHRSSLKAQGSRDATLWHAVIPSDYLLIGILLHPASLDPLTDSSQWLGSLSLKCKDCGPRARSALSRKQVPCKREHLSLHVSREQVGTGPKKRLKL